MAWLPRTEREHPGGPVGPIRRRRPATAIALTVGLLAGAAGCSSGSGDPGEGSGSAASGRAGRPDGPCAWATRGDRETNNIAYPDAAATYWAVSYDLAPGEAVELRGRFPAARYASFTSYGPYGGAVDVLTDRDIRPDAGSTNPFRGGASSSDAGRSDDDHRYTVVIDPDREPGHRGGAGAPNVVAGRPEPGSDAASRTALTTTTGPDGSTPSTAPDPGVANLLGGGGGEGTQGTVIYRIYISGDHDDPTGGAGLPEATVVSPDGERQVIPTCASPGASPRALELTQTYGPPTDRTAPPEPAFVRPEAGAANLYPNPDNVYIATIVEHRPGQIVVIRGTAPTVPDPAAGRPVGSGEQLRYWSLCTNEYRKPYPVSSCVIDRDVILDERDRYTFVVSTREDRPRNATEADGVTWLDWGSTDVDNLLLLRHMLADPTFGESAVNLEPGTLADSTMGSYAPVATYCSRDTFEQRGPDACSG